MTKDQAHNATITFKVTNSPLATLYNLQVELCKFLSEMEEFYKSRETTEKDKATTDIYSIAKLIHAVVGVSCRSSDPQMLIDLARFCQDLGNNNRDRLFENIVGKEK